MNTRQPIIAVLGHIDHGKTTFLDKVRGSSIANKEAGKITQHIGATEVPIDTIQTVSGELLKKFGFSLDIPGLLFIDTPGHEAFTNLRKRGGSIADLAVVVVDITQGFQPQTIEAVEILKSFKTPFILALNKVDKLHGYDSNPGSFIENLAHQHDQMKEMVDEKVYETVGKLHELGFESERFDRCNDFGKQIAIIPISAQTGEGLPETLMLLSGLSQKFLKEKLNVHETETGKGNVLEVREEKGLGHTIDIIISEGTLNVNDTIALAGRQGIITTKIRALLKPKPLEEIRETKESFESVKSVTAASGVKIAAPQLEGALPGSPITAVKEGNEADAIAKEITGILTETEAVGPIIKADTLGALEAMTRLLDQSHKLKPKKTDVGDVTRKDVMEAIGVKEHDHFKSVIFAFNVKTDTKAAEEAKKNDIQIFSGSVIYKLLDDFTAWEKELREKEKQATLEQITSPTKLQLLPNHTFRNSKPAVVGVKIIGGTLKVGVRIMKANGNTLGKITGIQSKNKSVDSATHGEEVAVSIADAVVGRNLEERDTLFTFISPKRIGDVESAAHLFSSEEKGVLEEIKEIIDKKVAKEEVHS
jgi:translation initiation factor 5B